MSALSSVNGGVKNGNAAVDLAKKNGNSEVNGEPKRAIPKETR